VDPVPDPLLLRKFGSPGNRTPPMKFKPKIIICRFNVKNNCYFPELCLKTGCSGDYLGQRMKENEAGESHIMNYIITAPYKPHVFSDYTQSLAW
jgi:hypothetical protein